MSYARADEAHHRGYVSDLCTRLSGEVQVQTGLPFDIFFDRKDIRWGEEWQSRIDAGLDDATFLIPILTPSFFRSDHCRTELMTFARLRQSRSPERYILPIYYVDVNELNGGLVTDDVVKTVTELQWVDWRELRLETLDTKDVRVAIANLAKRIKETIDNAPQRADRDAPHAVTPALDRHEKRSPQGLRLPGSERIVDITDGPYKAISEALADAQPGDKILVRPGVYYDRFAVTIPVEIIGDGPRGDITVEEDAESIVDSRAATARIENLRICQLGKGDVPAVLIWGGRIIIDNCDITSRGGVCIAITEQAEPIVRSSHIHHGGKGGISISGGARPLIVDNDIDENYLSGIFIFDHAAPLIRSNKIHDGKQSGIYLYDNGTGVIDDNDIYRNAHAGIASAEGATPFVSKNRISRCGHYGGIYVFRAGRGIFENNDLSGNRNGPWQIAESSLKHVVRRGNVPNDD